MFKKKRNDAKFRLIEAEVLAAMKQPETQDEINAARIAKSFSIDVDRLLDYMTVKRRFVQIRALLRETR